MKAHVCAVTGVNTDAAGLSWVTTDAGGGPDGIPGVANGLPGYFPQSGDKVVIAEVANGVWTVISCLTPNRGLVVDVPEVPSVTVANSAPVGWTQISTVYAEPGVFSNPDMYLVPSAPVSPPPPSTAGTLPWAASGTSSWRADFGGSWATNRVYQGTYGGYGPWTGLWFYPSPVSALSGKTLTAVRMHLSRRAEGGDGGPVQLHMYLHGHASQPAGAPTLIGIYPTDVIGAAPSWGSAVDVTLPLAWGQALQAGTAAGIAISASDQGSYAILSSLWDDPASGQLAFDYS